MKALYIIGNGFDLWHSLPTSYADFYKFAQGTLDEIENYYLFDLNATDPWHDFENALGAFDADGFFDFHNEVDITSDDFRPRDIYGLEDGLTEQTDMHVSKVRKIFNDWVNTIDVSYAKRKIKFPEHSQFITFNYTSTLQSIYDIEDSRVLHIHGRAGKNGNLIFGHGENVSEPPDFDENGDSTSDMFSDAERAARYPLYAFKKPVDDILEKNESYFYTINDIDEIVIIGHSLNTIDQPYFSRINDSAANAQWKVFCYTKDEEKGHTQSLVNCGVCPDRIEIMTYADL